MQSAIDQFNISIRRVRDMIAIHNSIKAQATTVLDLSDILRAALVLSVSALDYYIHEIVRIGMLEIYQNQRLEPLAFSRFQISLGSARQQINSESNGNSWLESEIRERHGYKSFQKPDNIADAIRLISDKKLWEEVSRQMNRPAREIKQQLSLIVDRRNKIAHEADIDPTLSLGNRWPIDEISTAETADFIETVAQSIHKIL